MKSRQCPIVLSTDRPIEMIGQSIDHPLVEPGKVLAQDRIFTHHERVVGIDTWARVDTRCHSQRKEGHLAAALMRYCVRPNIAPPGDGGRTMRAGAIDVNHNQGLGRATQFSWQTADSPADKRRNILPAGSPTRTGSGY